ncbi:MAG: hypothetical protein ACMXYD_01180 [Candidatus Woesearchaeota archaeon]
MGTKRREQSIVEKRIDHLEAMAQNWLAQGRREDAQTAIKHLKRLAQSKARRITHIKKQTCKNCHAPLQAGITCTVRIKQNRRVLTCTECNTIKRLGF